MHFTFLSLGSLRALVKGIDIHKAADAVREELAAFQKTGKLSDPRLGEAVAEPRRRLAEKWRLFIEVCGELEKLSRKELKEIPFTKAEKDFILSYGRKLASIMMYEAEACQFPEDDSPKAACIWSNPFSSVRDKKGRSCAYFHVAVGRPLCIWVLFPARGGEVLCRGSVVPYYEFVYPRRIVEDAEWKRLLDSKKAPSLPKWFRNVVYPGTGLPRKDPGAESPASEDKR